MIQNRKRMETPLASALMKLTARAAVCGLSPKRMMKNRPISANSGAPGGWGTSSLKQLEMNSPQSQKLPVASMVMTYTVVAMSPMIAPTMLLTLLKRMGYSANLDTN